ncbi:MAG TPA: (Fe-S)-binding protein [Deltaproteobacteria bacterium]|nr:(Fe-S)-binding protein [Deltaproteobacteria bacterium]
MKVSLFIPCTVDLLMPRVGIAAYRLLERTGARCVYHEEQTCCGQAFFNSGFLGKARRVARHFVEVFENDDVVVSPCGSCVVMVKQHYPELFAGDAAWYGRAVDLSGRVYELSQFLVDVMGVTDLGAVFDGAVAYHESCHVLRGLGVSDEPKRLISAVRGARLVDMDGAQSCCGFGGEFSVVYPDISREILKDKVAAFIGSKADVLVLNEPGCLLNIGGYVRRHHPSRRVMHLAEFLDTHSWRA